MHIAYNGCVKTYIRLYVANALSMTNDLCNTYAHLRERHIDSDEMLEGQEVIDHQHGQGAQQRQREQAHEGESTHDAQVEALRHQSADDKAPRQVLEQQQQDVDEDREADQK